MKQLITFFIANLFVLSLMAQKNSEDIPSFHSSEKKQIVQIIEENKSQFFPGTYLNKLISSIPGYLIDDKVLSIDTIKNKNLHLFDHKNKSFTKVQSGNSLKSSSTLRYCLDSAIFTSWNDSLSKTINSLKEYYEYNTKGLNTLYIESDWDLKKNKWINYLKTESSYNDKKQLILENCYDWEEKWIPSHKYEYEFDELGNQTIIARYDWDISSAKWAGKYKHEYAYNSIGKEILYIAYEWDPTGEKWVPENKTEKSFNAEGKELLKTTYTWDIAKNQWIGDIKDVSNYDSSNVRTSYYQYYWNKETSQWISINQTVKDANHETILFVYFKWDETAKKWIGELKYEAFFNSEGDQTKKVEYKWDSENNYWINKWKIEYEYDAKGNNLNVTEYNWNQEKGTWVNLNKIDNQFNTKNEVTLKTNSAWNTETELWDNKTQEFNNYDTFGNNTGIIHREWDTESGNWIDITKTERTYDSNGNETLQITYKWDVDKKQWVGDFIGMYTYDISGNMTIYVKFVWDEDNNGWINYSKAEEFTDSDGKKTTKSRYIWDKTQGLWIGQSKVVEYVTGLNIFTETEIRYGWDLELKDWVPAQKMEIVYTDEEGIVSEKMFIWDSIQKNWLISVGVELTFDYSHTMDDLILPYWYQDSFLFHHMLKNYNMNLENSISMSATFYYSEINLTGLKQYQTGLTQVFPNPATDKLTFKWEDSAQQLRLDMYDSNGRIVLQDLIFNNSSISIGNLAKGMYLYRLTNKNETVSTGKISVR